MALPQQKLLRHDVFRAQQKLANIEQVHGKQSIEYKEALKHFARLWSVLRMTRAHEDFLHEITK